MQPDSEGLTLSVVIPCYNERNRLPPTLDSVRTYLDERGFRAEVLIVDDGSRDGTRAWAEDMARQDRRIRVLGDGTNRGKGAAVRTGMLAAEGRYALFMDADGATPIRHFDDVRPVLESGRAQVAVGSRAIRGARVVAAQPWYRKMAGDLYGTLTRLLVLRGIADTQCGFKVFTRESARALFGDLTLTSAIFDIELLLRAARRGYRVAEIPVEWRHDGDTRLGYNLSRSLRVVGELLALRRRHRVWWPVRVPKA